jgi:hypothetical protein
MLFTAGEKGCFVTIALTLKVNDGLVLAADSASTVVAVDDTGKPAVVNIYNHANKIFNLIKGEPIGAVTWGGGNIGSASMSTLMKDFRQELVNERNRVRRRPSIEEVAQFAKQFFFEERYQKQYSELQPSPEIGILIVGYSDGASLAEEYELTIQAPNSCLGPRLVRQAEECGATWYGQGEPITRLVLGYSNMLSAVLVNDLNVPQDQVDPVMLLLQQKLQASLISPAMPIQDAIDLAEFLVGVAVNFARFTPGPQIVGGPIEVAAITKHEGFKWIRRKYYFHSELNPDVNGRGGGRNE